MNTNTNAVTIYLRDGRAWVAETKEGRARVSSLTSWLSAHPGRSAIRILAQSATAPPAPSAPALRSATLAILLGRLFGRRTVADSSDRGPAIG